MNRLIKSVFGSLGVEVRLHKNIPAARAREKHAAMIRQWELLRRYRPNTILDIGANEGQCAAILREVFPAATILSFEPLSDCFTAVEKYLADHGPGKAFQTALGDRNETTTIHRNDFTPSSSMLPMAQLHKEEFPQTESMRPEEVQVQRLDDMAPSIDITPPYVIKVDVQGFEGQVIEGGRKTFSNAEALVVELSSYSLYEGQSTFESVQEQLETLGFLFRGVIEQAYSKSDRRILQFDGLFENRRFDAEPEESR
ncbi:MAG: FkbM family methyltransferase [Planctomycetota bacterium]